MGEIREELILIDRFSASFARFDNLAISSAAQLGRIDQAAGAVTAEVDRMGEASASMSSSGFARVESQMVSIRRSTTIAADQQERQNENVRQTNSSAGGLLSVIKGIVSAVDGIKIGKDILKLSDTMVQTDAKLSQMNDHFQTTDQLQEKIYQSAQRSRTSYQSTVDVVTKLGQCAGGLFQNNDETIQFAENLNKSFAMAGASQEEIASQTQQLTQALQSGALSGEDLNAVFGAAPNAIQTIADYMNVPIGKIGEMADNGEITAEVVKNAMLSATDDINEGFGNMPLTWGDTWTIMKNAATQSMGDVLTKINKFLNSDTGKNIINGIGGAFEVLAEVGSVVVDGLASGAEFIASNWEYISPILMAIGIVLLAAGMAGVVSGLAMAVAWIAASWPIILITVLLAAMILGFSQAGLTAEVVCGVIGESLGALYAIGYNLVADLWNLFAVFGEFFANFMNDPVSAVAHLVFGLLDTVLGVVETIANAIDAVVGTNMSGAVAGFRENMGEWVDDAFGAQAVTIERMTKLDTAQTMAAGAKKGAEIGAAIDNSDFDINQLLEGATGGAGAAGGAGDGGAAGVDVSKVGKVGNVGSVGKIEKDVNIADENIKLLRDLSERKYLSLINLTVPQTNATINQVVNGGGESDIDAIMDALKNQLLQQNASHGNVAMA